MGRQHLLPTYPVVGMILSHLNEDSRTMFKRSSLSAHHVLTSAFVAGLLATMGLAGPAAAAGVAGSMSYSGPAVTVRDGDCVDVSVSINLSGFSASTGWTAEAAPQKGYASGAFDSGSGSTSTTTDLEV